MEIDLNNINTHNNQDDKEIEDCNKTITSLEKLLVFNKVNLLSKESVESIKTNHAYMQTTFYEHSTQAKYDFKVCDLSIYIPESNQLYISYPSENSSNSCFKSKIKWNSKFFIKIRQCFLFSDELLHLNKNYFTLSSKTEIDEDGLMNDNESFYLELHFNLKNEDVVAFNIKLQEINYQDSLNQFLNMFFNANQEKNIEYVDLKNKYLKLVEEKEDVEREVLKEEEGFNKIVNEDIVSFVKLYEEKERKLSENNV